MMILIDYIEKNPYYHKLFQDIMKTLQTYVKINKGVTFITDELYKTCETILTNDRFNKLVSNIDIHDKKAGYKHLKDYQIEILDDIGNLTDRLDDRNSKIINPTRVIREISSLESTLPFDWDSSVFIRLDEQNLSRIKFLITGPKDTPYSNGCYEFHLQLPTTYPNTVPKCLFVTTDSGRVRFNPNLYANGKVCLSLLGTWAGHESESWNADTSNLLQLFLSIQSLILCEEPYYNEPGYERSYGTPNGQKASKTYNDNIEYWNYEIAIIKMIQNPPECFKNVVLNHFKYKEKEILENFNIAIKTNPKLADLSEKLVDALQSIK
jgi:ubiquitin-protein ligase